MKYIPVNVIQSRVPLFVVWCLVWQTTAIMSALNWDAEVSRAVPGSAVSP